MPFKLKIYIQIVIPTKACPHESGYPETLDSRFHGNDMNFFLNLNGNEEQIV